MDGIVRTVVLIYYKSFPIANEFVEGFKGVVRNSILRDTENQPIILVD
jgi:hypothetical protein